MKNEFNFSVVRGVGGWPPPPTKRKSEGVGGGVGLVGGGVGI